MKVFIIVLICVVVLILLRNRRVIKSEELKKRSGMWGHKSFSLLSLDTMEKIGGLNRILSAEKDTDLIDEITSNDLDLDLIFRDADTCVSSIGEESLYHLLRTPALCSDELKNRRARIRYFIDNQNEAVNDLLLLSDLGKCKSCSFAETVVSLNEAGSISLLLCIVQFFALLISITLLVFKVRYSLIIFILVLFYNIISYFSKRSYVGDRMVSVNYLICLIRVSRRCMKRLNANKCSDFNEIRENIDGSLLQLSGFTGLGLLITAGGIKGSFVDGILDYVRMATHLDLAAFEILKRRAGKKQKQILTLMLTVGEWESDIVLASYFTSLPVYCEAELFDLKQSEILNGTTDNFYLLENAVHPLLDEPVGNSIICEHGILITGSNASGKSTFLKTAALCTLLAQVSGFVPAARYKAPFYAIYSSMSLKDNIEKGESYYMAEIRSIKRIANAAAVSELPVICFIDEVLRGTNTVERIAASSQLLNWFFNKHILVFAATHDLELSKLLENMYDNYHFEEDFDNEDIDFTYRLLSGPALSRNAISLLRQTGFDEDITEAAKKMAENYEKTGDWEML